MKSKNNDNWIVETIVPEEVYTDREEFLEYFYNAAIDAATRRTTSTVLLGQRRMGKTGSSYEPGSVEFAESNPAGRLFQ